MSHRSRRVAKPEFDRLDARRLLAAQLTAGLAHGVLTIRGTPAADVIAVQVQKGVVSVAGVDRTFPTARVRRIDVQGGAGDDTISVVGRNIPVRVNGGAGNDKVNGNLDAAPVSAPAPIVTAAATQPAVIAATQPVATQPVATPIPTTPTTVTTTTTTTTAPAVPVAAAPSLSASVQRIVDLTNAQRGAAGLAPLTVSPALTQMATMQSANMGRLDTMSHDLPGTDAPELTDRAAAVGYKYTALGENIAYNYPDADSVVAGWMASPGHRANILDADYTQIGVAVAFNADGEPYYTQEFGTPA